MPFDIAVMNDDIAKIGYDSMQQRTKKNTKFMKSTSPRTFKMKFLTCNVCVFYKKLALSLTTV